MSFDATQRAWAVRGLTAPQRLVLLRLAEHAGPDSCAWPSIRLLIEYTELSERTVRDALRGLESAGHIKTEHRQNERGNPISNRYRLLIPLICNGAPAAPPVNGAPGGRHRGARRLPRRRRYRIIRLTAPWSKPRPRGASEN